MSELNFIRSEADSLLMNWNVIGLSIRVCELKLVVSTRFSDLFGGMAQRIALRSLPKIQIRV